MHDAAMTPPTPPLPAARVEEIRLQMIDAQSSRSLMVMAPADIAALLAEVERLRAALREAQRIADNMGVNLPAQRCMVISNVVERALGEDSSHG